MAQQNVQQQNVLDILACLEKIMVTKEYENQPLVYIEKYCIAPLQMSDLGLFFPWIQLLH